MCKNDTSASSKIILNIDGDKMMKLIQVNRIYKDIIQGFKDEYLKSNTMINGGCGIHHYQNIDDWFDEVDKIVLGKSEHRVQSYTYMCMVEGKMVGMIDIRLQLPKIWYSAGHIGYSVLPSERNKGYATEALKEALKIAKDHHIQPIITCLQKNIASNKVILKNGGIFVEELIEDEETHLVYKFNQ